MQQVEKGKIQIDVSRVTTLTRLRLEVRCAVVSAAP
jgi:hypothetical protein